MRKPIVFYTLIDKQTGDMQVLDEASFAATGVDYEKVNAVLGGYIGRYTVKLKEEFRQAMQDVVNNGSIDDPTRRPHLMYAQYVESSDVPESVRTEPVVFALIGNEIEARVFPTMFRSADFLAAVRAEQERLRKSLQVPESPVSSSISNGESSIAG